MGRRQPCDGGDARRPEQGPHQAARRARPGVPLQGRAVQQQQPRHLRGGARGVREAVRRGREPRGVQGQPLAAPHQVQGAQGRPVRSVRGAGATAALRRH
eukprot:scaffold116024_cov69-Phaeocystis_antarctica.AAC.1